MSRSCSGIYHIRDINKQNLETILRAHYARQDITVSLCGRGIENFVGNNDFYNSEIKKISLKVRMGVDVEEDVHLVIKTSPPGTAMKFIQKLAKPLLKETVWYTIMHPMLSRKCPSLGDITPTCYHAYATDMDDITGGCWERACCALCYMPCRKYESGLIILEDLTKAKTPYHLIDKNQGRTQFTKFEQPVKIS
jgi:hypothetical protein